MAKKPPPPPAEYRFKPGESGNKSGRPKNLLTKDKVGGIISKCAAMTQVELREFVMLPTATMIELTIANIFIQAYEDCDSSKLEFLLQRSVGKVTEQVDLRQIEPFILQKRDGSQVVAGVKQGGDDDETRDS